jgi:hypothetical protein
MAPTLKGIALIVMLMLHSATFATGGKTDRNGCHASKKVGFHCHAGHSAYMSTTETKAERTSRIRLACAGNPNPKACRQNTP